MPRWLFHIVRRIRQLWLTVALYSLAGVLAALMAARFGRYVPADFPLKVGSDSVDDILSILASSMLAVVTFSLATLVAAYTSVVATVAPHAARLLVSDGVVRNALATFVGAFIYGIVGIVAVHTGYYGAQGRVILFFVTLVVLALVVLAMLRWIGQLSSLAQTQQVIDRVAVAVRSALAAPTSLRPLDLAAADGPPPRARPVTATAFGYVQNVDVRRLRRLVEAWGGQIHIEAIPGTLVHAGQPLLWLAGDSLPDDAPERARGAISIGLERTFEQDPRYGMRVLGEVAARALSPGVNDPGTARDVLARAVGLLEAWSSGGPKQRSDGGAPRLTVRSLTLRELASEALTPITRHGADDVALQVEFQRSLGALHSLGRPDASAAARAFSRLALAASLKGLDTRAERREVRVAAAALAALDPDRAADEASADDR